MGNIKKYQNKFTRLTLVIIVLVALPITVFAFVQYRPELNQAFTNVFGTKANLVVTITTPSPLTQIPWAHLAQGGEEPGRMLLPVVSQIKTLRPQYIRIDHVFDFYDVVHRTETGSLSFDWTKLDPEIRTINQTGAKPFLSVSYMPSAISSGSETDIPRDWGEWRQCVQALVEHVSGRSGLNITDTYYEVWNEPDLFGHFSVSTYLSLYRYAAIGAAQARNVQNFKFGGPATTGFYKNWMQGLLKMAQDNHLRLDFISWHRYSKTVGIYEEDLAAARSIISSFPEYQNAELLITEAGYDSANNPANDGALSAIHTLAMYSATFQKINRLFMFEIKDGPSDKQYWGRWGILTHEKYGVVPKPRYRAIEFLNKMRGSWYPVYGQGTWVHAFATVEGRITRLLVVNYDPAGKHTENVPISFVNLGFSTFSTRRIDFSGKVERNTVTIPGKDWSFEALMLPNTAAIFELEPIQVQQ